MMLNNKFIYMLLVVMAGFCVHTQSVYAQDGAKTKTEERQNTQKILWVPPANIAKYIENTKGQKRVVVIYATWCPACRAKIPFLMEAEQKSPGSIIAISVDEDYKTYKRFYNQYDHVPFRLIVNKGSQWSLAKALKAFGGKPWKAIPQVMFVNEANKVVSQGTHSNDSISRFLLGNKTLNKPKVRSPAN